ncbi:MAG TPA: osmoprotectant NAGGN system M42 family peptidase [Kiritimatiellia bacterium]|nr:osmoprotectant NAGGN system M42 family peptidase [Kiritimatiellia bacterium]
MKPIVTPDLNYLKDVLVRLMEIPSPSGYTDQIVHVVGKELEAMKIPFELTRRGAIKAWLEGKAPSPHRAVVAHLDTLGAMVKRLKSNGRLEVVPVGTWSSRFAEGARVRILTGDYTYTGTILPLKASGHIFNREVDTQPASWEHVEVRVDAPSTCREDLEGLRIYVGDFVGIDSEPLILDNGYIKGRHLDDKAGVAILLASMRALAEADLPLTTYFVFTLTEEVGTGASGILHNDVAELVAIDNAINGPGQNGSEFGVTIPLMDESGPFDYHLSQKLLRLCMENKIEYSRDVYVNYRCDAASAIESGHDVRTAMISFALDASHGYERTHIHSLEAASNLVMAYLQSPATFKRDEDVCGKLQGFPEQPIWPVAKERGWV